MLCSINYFAQVKIMVKMLAITVAGKNGEETTPKGKTNQNLILPIESYDSVVSYVNITLVP